MSDLIALDRQHVWHPYAPMSSAAASPSLVTGAAGTRLHLADGRRPIDAMSSWWAAIHGYRHPLLDEALARQAATMSHVMFGGLTHEPAIELCRRLVEIAPPSLSAVFLADSGSVSVEVALKMALQFQRGAGRPGRTRILSVRGGYHGDTAGAMSVSDPRHGRHGMFPAMLPSQPFLPRPPAGLDASVDEWVAEARAVVDRLEDDVAAVIVEPVLQGAGGMHVYPPAVLRWLRDVADERGWLLILDEIATGFGRTGELFAAHHAGVVPDIMCVGKALTGGYLTLAATLCTSRVAAGVDASESGALMHGPTFMGNPLACAVALASLDVLAGGGWRADVARIGAGLDAGLAPGREVEGVVDVRTIGAVGVVQLDRPVDVPRATSVALDHGVWVRPFRDLVYVMPPYITTDDEIDVVSRAVLAVARGNR